MKYAWTREEEEASAERRTAITDKKDGQWEKKAETYCRWLKIIEGKQYSLRLVSQIR